MAGVGSDIKIRNCLFARIKSESGDFAGGDMDKIAVGILLINGIAFFVYGMDKQRAVRGKWRVPEKTLLGLAVLGGSLGALFGMHLFHHKTKKPKFYIGIPVILVLQVLTAAGYFIFR